MSADSGGTAASHERRMADLPETSPEDTNAVKRQLVSRRRDVELVFHQQVAVDAFVDAIISATSIPKQIECIQSINPRKFLVSFRSAEAAEYFCQVSAPALRIAGAMPSCRWLGSERKRIRVGFLPNAVSNNELVKVLKNYGEVVQVTDEVYANRPFVIKTGTRLVDMDMSKAVPNILSVCGFSASVTYRGVITQCRRCLQKGHFKAECTAPFCDRCRTFGHREIDCAAPCLKCKSLDHHWKECTVRSYAFAAASHTKDEARANPTEAAIAAPMDQLGIAAKDALPTAPVTAVNTGNEEAEPPYKETSTPTANYNGDTSNIEDGFVSPAEYNSLSELEATGVFAERVLPAASQSIHAPVTCKQENGADDGRDAEWRDAKARNKKRKKLSLTSEKSPDPKKVARDNPVNTSQETACDKITDDDKGE